MRIDVDTVELPTAPEGHEADCDCPHCLMVDMFRHLQTIGVDPRPYAWYEVPTDWRDGVKRQRIVFDLPPLPKQRRRKPNRRDRWGEWLNDEVSPLAHIADAELPAPAVPARERIPVRVEDIGAGAWALLTGVDCDGAPVVVSGAVIGGPDDTGRSVYAVEVRRAGVDRVVYVPAGGTVFLVDDPAEHDDRAAHAVAPVYGDGADVVHLYRRRLEVDGVPRRNDKWTSETYDDVPAAQLSLWEREGVYERLSAVHHRHRPVSEGAR